MTDFSIEKSIDGPVIGLDEVGRGPLAGPVVSCGCYFSNYDDLESEIPITDSKKHTTKQREKERAWRRVSRIFDGTGIR